MKVLCFLCNPELHATSPSGPKILPGSVLAGDASPNVNKPVEAETELRTSFMDDSLTKIIKHLGSPVVYRFPTVTEADCENNDYLRVILNDYRPDIVYVEGSNLFLFYALTRLFPEEKMVFNLQEVLTISKPKVVSPKKQAGFLKGIAAILFRRANDRVQNRNWQAETARLSATIIGASHVIGASDLDYKKVLSLNPMVKYYFVDELANRSFYQSEKAVSIYNEIYFSSKTIATPEYHVFLDYHEFVKTSIKQYRLFLKRLIKNHKNKTV